MFIADHCILNPVVQSLLAVKFDIKRIRDCTKSTDDESVMKVCLAEKAVLITLDQGMAFQAHYYQFAKNGLTIVLLRWKHQTYKDWQQMVQIILRDASVPS
jgi:predicted nuclease of predicted toxin-antitoxin system